MFHCRRSCVDWSSSSNLGASTLTPIRTRCLQQGVVTLVSKNQISPDSLPSYIRELAPRATRGKKSEKVSQTITAVHRHTFKLRAPTFSTYEQTNPVLGNKRSLCNIFLPGLVTYITSPLAWLQSSLINLELLEYHKPRSSSSSISHTQSTCLPTALHNYLLAPAHHPAVRSLLYQSRTSSLTTTRLIVFEASSTHGTSHLRFGLFPIVSVRQPLRAVANNTSRSIQSHAYTYKVPGRIRSASHLEINYHPGPQSRPAQFYVIRSLTR
jgi:hypothetical protein